MPIHQTCSLLLSCLALVHSYPTYQEQRQLFYNFPVQHHQQVIGGHGLSQSFLAQVDPHPSVYYQQQVPLVQNPGVVYYVPTSDGQVVVVRPGGRQEGEEQPGYIDSFLNIFGNYVPNWPPTEATTPSPSVPAEPTTEPSAESLPVGEAKPEKLFQQHHLAQLQPQLPPQQVPVNRPFVGAPHHLQQQHLTRIPPAFGSLPFSSFQSQYDDDLKSGVIGIQKYLALAKQKASQATDTASVAVEAAQAHKVSNDEVDNSDSQDLGPSIAQAKPQAVSVAGPGGVAAAAPVGTAVVGPGGMALSAPQATAVAGANPKKTPPVAAIAATTTPAAKNTAARSFLPQYQRSYLHY